MKYLIMLRLRHWAITYTISTGLLFCSFIIFGYQVLQARQLWLGNLVDDAYISMRYAANWAEGNGIVWQLGDRVEGYTNFLQVAIFALGLKLGIKGEMLAHGLGLSTGVGIIILTFILAWQLKPNKDIQSWPTGLGALVVAALPAFAIWTLSGLETPLFIFLCLSAILSLHESLKHPEQLYLPILTGIILVGVSMTRPDGVILALILATVISIYIWKSGKKHRKHLVHTLFLIMLVFIVGYGTYFTWRWIYYGQILPNTFYVKVGTELAQVERGLSYSWQMLNTLGIYGLVIAAGLSIFPFEKWLCGKTCQPQHMITFWSVLIFAFSYTLYLIFIGGDTFGPRLALIVVVFFAILLDILISRVAAMLKRIQLNMTAVSSVLIFISVVTIWFIQPFALTNLKPDITEYNWKRLGQWLKENSPKEAVLAIDAAGTIPYFSNLRTIDMLGLNDLHIAHMDIPDFGEGKPGHEKYDAAYIFANHPDWIAAWIDSNGKLYWGLNSWPEIEGYSLYMVVQTESLSKPWKKLIHDTSTVRKLWDDGYKYGLWKHNDQNVIAYTEIDMALVESHGIWEWRPRAVSGLDYFFADAPGSSFTFKIGGDRTLAITALCHNWSGMMSVQIGHDKHLVDLFSENFNTQCVYIFTVHGKKTDHIPVSITVETQRNPASFSTQIFLNRILLLEKSPIP